MPKRRRASKRKRSGKAKGGDKNPQILTIPFSWTASQTWVTTSASIPLLAILSGSTKVIEIISVDVESTVPDHVFSTNKMVMSMGSASYSGKTKTEVTSHAAAGDRRNFFFYRMADNHTRAAVDYTDENGNGILYPAQQFFVNAHSDHAAGGQTAGTAVVYITYRIKNATLNEYIGIINQYTVTVN